MKTRIAVLTVIVALLLLGSVALAQSNGRNPSTLYSVGQGVATGGIYHLTSLTWHVEGAAGGGGYHLSAPDSPTLRGNGCCCTYLPCLLRNSH